MSKTHPNPGMKLIVLFTASLSWAYQQQAVPPKYQYRDPVTSKLLICDQCPPGKAVKRHCSEEMPTECQPCPEKQFAENWHWSDSCQYCSSVCKEKQLVKQSCNSTHDQVCECAPGYHLVVEFCIAHSLCQPGYGMTALGSPVSDTICERCPEGFFSPGGSSYMPCRPHRNCSEQGLKTLRWGSSTSDNVCGPQEKLILPDCSRHHISCHTDVTLCEEAFLQSLASLQLSSAPLEQLLESLPGRRVDHKRLEKLKKTCSPQQQVLQLLRLWQQQNKDQEKMYGIMKGVSHCQRKVSRCYSLKNVTFDDLLLVAKSLPGKQVQEEDVLAVVSACLPRQQILEILHLWKTANNNMDLAKSLHHSLKVLRQQGAPRYLLKGLKKISRVIGTTSNHKMYKLLVSMLMGKTCFKAQKPLNE